MTGFGGSNKDLASAALPGLSFCGLNRNNKQILIGGPASSPANLGGSYLGVSLTVNILPLKKECWSDLYILGPSATNGEFSGF